MGLDYLVKMQSINNGYQTYSYTRVILQPTHAPKPATGDVNKQEHKADTQNKQKAPPYHAHNPTLSHTCIVHKILERSIDYTGVAT